MTSSSPQNRPRTNLVTGVTDGMRLALFETFNTSTRPGVVTRADIRIHNAGVSAVSAFESSRLSECRAIITVNLRAPMLLTNALNSR
jgi:NAD(P)-dependent dehydrogenase (short-subunit alcohol dehydrogenase family)